MVWIQGCNLCKSLMVYKLHTLISYWRCVIFYCIFALKKNLLGENHSKCLQMLTGFIRRARLQFWEFLSAVVQIVTLCLTYSTAQKIGSMTSRGILVLPFELGITYDLLQDTVIQEIQRSQETAQRNHIVYKQYFLKSICFPLQIHIP